MRVELWVYKAFHGASSRHFSFTTCTAALLLFVQQVRSQTLTHYEMVSTVDLWVSQNCTHRCSLRVSFFSCLRQLKLYQNFFRAAMAAAGAWSSSRGVAGVRATTGLFSIFTLLCLVCLSSSLIHKDKLVNDLFFFLFFFYIWLCYIKAATRLNCPIQLPVDTHCGFAGRNEAKSSGITKKNGQSEGESVLMSFDKMGTSEENRVTICVCGSVFVFEFLAVPAVYPACG